jgi:hypothetical protein
VLIDDKELSSKLLYELYISTPTHMATKLHHVIIKEENGSTYILGYTMLKVVSSSELLPVNGVIRKTSNVKSLEASNESIEKEEITDDKQCD